MPAGAARHPQPGWLACARAASLIIGACLLAPEARAETRQIVGATYIEPTDRYGHGAVEGGEYAAVRLTLSDGFKQTVRYADGVFEDTAPRLFDLDGDGAPEVVTVLSTDDSGARIQIMGYQGGQILQLGHSAPIGQRHRWLAIAGIADFDSDGHSEIAYVDRPHLAKTLRLLRVEIGPAWSRFTEVASLSGLTNHKYGSPVIEGGVRRCDGAAPVVVTADQNWKAIMETTLQRARLVARAVAPYDGAQSLSDRLNCP